MRSLAFSLLLTISMIGVGCRPAQSISDSSSQSIEQDGSSYQKAIVVKSIRSEYEWIEAKYPGSKVVKQALVFNEKKPYDILTVKLADGNEKDFYFDISKFFGKF